MAAFLPSHLHIAKIPSFLQTVQILTSSIQTLENQVSLGHVAKQNQSSGESRVVWAQILRIEFLLKDVS